MLRALALAAFVAIGANAAKPTISSTTDGNLAMNIPAGSQFIVDCPSTGETTDALNECLAQRQNAQAAAGAASGKLDYGTIIGVDSCGGSCPPVSGGTVRILVVGDLFADVPGLYKCHFTDSSGAVRVVDGIAQALSERIQARVEAAPISLKTDKYRIDCESPTYTVEEVQGAGLRDWNLTVAVHLPGQKLEYLSSPEHYFIDMKTAGPAVAHVDDLEFLSKNQVQQTIAAEFFVTDEDTALSSVEVEATSSDTAIVSVIGIAGSGTKRVLNMQNEVEEGEVTITLSATDDHGRVSLSSFKVIVISTFVMPCKQRRDDGIPDGTVTVEDATGRAFQVYCNDGWAQKRSGSDTSYDQGSGDAAYFVIQPCLNGKSEKSTSHGWWKAPSQTDCDAEYSSNSKHPLWGSGGVHPMKVNGHGTQSFTTVFEGDYEFTLFGGRGGFDNDHSSARPGDGGRTKAIVSNVKAGTTFYFRVGQKGADGDNNGDNIHECPSGDPSINGGVYARMGGAPWHHDNGRWNSNFCSGKWASCGGFNGGGPTISCSNPGGSSGGGGTDIRICGFGEGTDCSGSNPPLDGRILVAGGGGGSSTENNNNDPRKGGHGGGTNGESNERYTHQSVARGGSQTQGGYSYDSNGHSRNEVRSHGSGDGFKGQGGCGGQNDAGGGGGGYYGGAGPPYNAGGGGGSGCTDCKPASSSINGLSIRDGSMTTGGNNHDQGYILMRIR